MPLKRLSPTLKSQLDNLMPGWKKLIDKKILDDAVKQGVFNAKWFIERLLEKARSRFYHELISKSDSYVTSLFSLDAVKSFPGMAKSWFSFANKGFSGLIEVEKGLVQIYKKCSETSSESGESLCDLGQGGIDAFIKSSEEVHKRAIEDLEERIGTMKTGILEQVAIRDASYVADVTQILVSNSILLVDSKRTALKNAQKLIIKYMNFKLKSIVDGGESKKKAKNRRNDFLREMEEFISSEFIEQKVLRTSMVSAIVKKVVGKDGVKELCSFIASFSSHISPKVLNHIQKFAKSGYTTLMNEVTVTNIYSALQSIGLIERQNQEEINKIYSNPFYQWCNNYGAAWKHLVTFGACTGFTLGANLRAWIDGMPIDWKNLVFSLDVLLNMALFPWFPAMASHRFINLSVGSLVDEYIGVDFQESVLDVLMTILDDSF